MTKLNLEYNTDNEILNTIATKEVRDLVIDVLNNHSSEEKFKDATGVADWLIFLLKDDKILSATANAFFIDFLLAAAMLHNVTYEYNKDKWTKMFDTRDLILELNEKYNMPENAIDAICQPIEQQLGKDMPNKLLSPNPNSPGAHFALACSIYYKKVKK